MFDHQDPSDIKSRCKALDPLPSRFRSGLLSMYYGEPQIGGDGKFYNIHSTTYIPPEEGMWLFQLCRDFKPNATLEIGFAYGYSTLFFLAALSENGTGHHTAIDPFEDELWHGIGMCHAKSVESDDYFRFIKSKSIIALPHLANSEKFDVIFIDGNHRFDDALVDFTLSAELCTLGGYIVLDDMWLPSIRMVAAFIHSNRPDFEELKAPLLNVAVFRRIGNDNREWNHYVQFPPRKMGPS